MAQEKKHTFDGKSREERVTGKAPLEEALGKESREYKVAHPKKKTDG